MLGNGFRYYVRHFWQFSDFCQMLDLGPLIYCRSTLKIQETPQSFKKKRILQIWWSHILICLRMRVPQFLTFLHLNNLESWNFGTHYKSQKSLQIIENIVFFTSWVEHCDCGLHIVSPNSESRCASFFQNEMQIEQPNVPKCTLGSAIILPL